MSEPTGPFLNRWLAPFYAGVDTRYVIPHFQQLNVNCEASIEWVVRMQPELGKKAQEAVAQRFAQHAAEMEVKP